VSLLSYDATSLPVLEGVWQFSGGVVGFLKWYHEHTWQYVEGAEVFIKDPPFSPDHGHDLGDWEQYWQDDPSLTILAEKFTARGQNGFSLRTDALEPLRVEGAMIALGMMPDYSVAEKRWVDPAQQYLAGGRDKADKKKRQHALLKDLGYYVTGKDVGCPDADDVRSSLAHSLGYLMRVEKHEPTYRAVSDWVEGSQ
jgi:hypothetical protein